MEIIHNGFRFLTLQIASPHIKISQEKNIVRLFSEASLCINVFIP